jgi:hypothetical protein
MHVELSPVDEKIKMRVMRDMLKLTFNTGNIPRDKEVQTTTSFMPVVTKETEYKYKEFMVLERIRHVFEHCCGVRGFRKAGGVGSIAFQRVGRKLRVKAAISDLVFVKVKEHHVDHMKSNSICTGKNKNKKKNISHLFTHVFIK